MRMIGRVVHEQAGVPEEAHSRAETWIIVCEHFHGALGPVPSERLADELAALASEMGGCTYRPVRLALAPGRVARRAVHEEPHREPQSGRRAPVPLAESER
jgi:hypothetical protein